jgi:hypothetical protein
MIESIIELLEANSVNAFVVGHIWVWPMMEIFHFVGLCLVLGSLLVIDLGLMGVIKHISPSATHTLMRAVLIGFGLNLLTGVLFVIGDPSRYFINISFQIKMVLIIFAALNALWYIKKIAPKLEEKNEFTAVMETKIVGFLSLLCWFGVLIFGRLIPYIGTG